MRDFERNNPNEIRRVLDDLVKRGIEPTKAAVRRAIAAKKVDKIMQNRFKKFGANMMLLSPFNP